MFSSKAITWVAIAATVCFLLLIVLQVSELRSFSAAPSVWPTAK